MYERSSRIYSSCIEKIPRIPDADKVNGVVAIGMGKKDLRNLIESVDNMMEKQQRTLLENFSSEDQVKQKLDDYKSLREEFRKIWESLIH